MNQEQCHEIDQYSSSSSNPLYVKVCIQKFISSLEKQHEIKIVFACEGGSRGWGTHTEQSDYDVRGIYMLKEQKYLSVSKAIGVLSGFSKNLPGTDLLFDYIFMDVRKLLKRNLANERNQLNLIFQSKQWYTNSIPDQVLNLLRNNLPMPLRGVKGHLKDLQKIIQNSSKISPKSALNCIIYSLQLIHFIAFQNFPLYNCKEEVEYLKQYQVNLKEQQQEQDNDTQRMLQLFSDFYLNQIFDKFDLYLIMKEKNEASVSEEDAEFIKSFVQKIVSYKFDNNQKPKQLTSTQLNDIFIKMVENIQIQ